MLKELKTVMGIRAQEREERERKALLRMRGEEDEQTEELIDNNDSVPSVDELSQGVRKRNIVPNPSNTSSMSSSEPSMFCTKCNASNTTITCSCASTASVLDTKSAAFVDRDRAWDDLANKPYKPPQERMEVGEEDEEGEDSLEKRRERLGRVIGQGMGGLGGAFQLNVAAVAALKGQEREGAGEDTFGDSSEDEGVIEN